MSKILIAGDILIDRYIKVSTCRTSQESPLPVYDVMSGEEMLGGAANVAAAFRRFDTDNKHQVYLAGIMDDRFIDMTEALQINSIYGDGRSLVKTRFHTEDNKLVFRADEGLFFDPVKVQSFVELFVEQVDDQFDMLIVSDYDKGTITPEFIEKLKSLCGYRIVDSKKKDLRMFEGFDVLNINQQEYSEQCSNRDYVCPERLFANVIVTKGAEGSELRIYEETTLAQYIVHCEDFPTVKKTPVDVTGCGDVHTAALAYALVEGVDLRSSIRFANGAAGHAVTQFGTSRINV